MYIDDAITQISGFEGRVHWMYLDTRGNVTAGVGQMLPNAKSATKFPFRRPTAELANPGDILKEFALVKSMKPGLVAGAYRRAESLLLDDPSINAMLHGSLSASAGELAGLFPMFYTYPDAAKVALLDMHFNLGTTKLGHEYTGLCKAVNLQRWPIVSQQCHRMGISAARNDWTAAQFMLCVRAVSA
jgi:GH24 family phage-related lysozyme (muramidase)